DLHPLTYTRAWHDDFLRFEDREGKIVSRPGRPESADRKLAVLAEMYEIHQLMSSGDMLKRVQEVASRKYGYEFGKNGEGKISVAPVKLEVARQEGPGGFIGALHTSLAEDPTPKNAAGFLQDIAGMRARNTMSGKQFREALIAIDKYVPLRANDKLDRALR